jgi:hypothetical protein
MCLAARRWMEEKTVFSLILNYFIAKISEW